MRFANELPVRQVRVRPTAFPIALTEAIIVAVHNDWPVHRN